MKTMFLLMAEHGQADIPLSDVAEKYLGISPAKAARLAGAQQLPFPVFRGGSQKSPWLVSVPDLASWTVATCYKNNKLQWLGATTEHFPPQAYTNTAAQRAQPRRHSLFAGSPITRLQRPQSRAAS